MHFTMAFTVLSQYTEIKSRCHMINLTAIKTFSSPDTKQSWISFAIGGFNFLKKQYLNLEEINFIVSKLGALLTKFNSYHTFIYFSLTRVGFKCFGNSEYFVSVLL